MPLFRVCRHCSSNRHRTVTTGNHTPAKVSPCAQSASSNRRSLFERFFVAEGSGTCDEQLRTHAYVHRLAASIKSNDLTSNRNTARSQWTTRLHHRPVDARIFKRRNLPQFQRQRESTLPSIPAKLGLSPTLHPR